MAANRRDDLMAFRDFVNKQLADGGANLSPDECLALWDLENESDQERADTVQAVREALEQMRAGNTGVPLREALDELRRKYNLPVPR
jgi:hypothetical protein